MVSRSGPGPELGKGHELSGIRLADLLRGYGIRPRTIWIGENSAKGYLEEDFQEAFRRYITRTQLDALLQEGKPQKEPEPPEGSA